MKSGDRVKLNNPDGFNNYQGTLGDKYLPGWWFIQWDCGNIALCTSPMEEKHLIPLDKLTPKP